MCKRHSRLTVVGSASGEDECVNGGIVIGEAASAGQEEE